MCRHAADGLDREGQRSHIHQQQALARAGQHFAAQPPGLQGSVKDDLKYLQDYLVIQSTRFGANFSYEIDIDDACMEFIIPKLLLQPLLERS